MKSRKLTESGITGLKEKVIDLKNILKLKSIRSGLIVVLLLVLPSVVFARTFDAVVAFGDSLSDHEGLQAYLGAYDPVDNPTGTRAVWSDGNTWVEYLADELKATLDNNAIGGAMTLGHENADVQAMSDAGTLPQLGLVGQVNTYISESPSFTASETLFTIWIGGNDFLEFGRGELATNDPSVMISNAMTNIQIAINALYQNGAMNFLVLTLPDIGSTPLYNSRPANEITAATALTTSYNTALLSLIVSLRTNLSGITIWSFDVFTYMNSMITNNTFPNVTGTYMELDNEGNYTGTYNGPAEDYLFWDLIHPTTKAHGYVGKEVAETLFAEDDDDDSTCFITSLVNQQ